VRTRILVVDDNPITRKLVRFALEQHGFAIIEADSGAAALAALEREAPALVIQDLVLPDIDGFELVARLRARPQGREIPILAFSGLLSKIEEARVSTVGFDDVIVKPVEPSQLLQIVKAHVPSGTATRERFGEGRRLLIVDDDAVQLKLARFRLERVGFQVDGAADGLEALERLAVAKPDVVVSDVMMPRLDGFALCVAVREDPGLAELPVVLMTNSYLEEGDRELARRAGASAFVVRTPEMAEIVQAVRRTLQGSAPAPATAPPPAPAPAPAPTPPASFEAERTHRLLRQLERQVALNAGISQRCSSLSAELFVLSGISEALAKDQDPAALDVAVDTILAACLDAGGISVGALFLERPDGSYRVHTIGDQGVPRGTEVERFFGSAEVLREILAGRRPPAVPPHMLPSLGASSAVVAPLVHAGRGLGALVMLSKTAELQDDARSAFGQGVANQIAQALALAKAFADKRTSERRAHEQAAVLGSVLESMADGVLAADEGGRFTIRNAAAETILGLSDRGVAEIGGEDWGQPFRHAIAGNAVDGVEVLLRRNGDEKWLDVTARPLRDGEGVVRGGVAVFRDVTSAKTAATQLMVSDRMATVGTLAAGVAHEINNPLTALTTNLELVSKQLEALARRPELAKHLAEIGEEIRDAVEATERVRLIVRDLKTFSRSEDETRGPVDVQRVLDSSLRMAWTEIRHRAHLEKRYAEVPPVNANESRLGQVFLNLIVNAAQAIPEGQADQNEITLVTRYGGGGRVIVEVIDTGPGIPPDVLARLFTPFFTTKAKGVGTGLGLSICQRLVTMIGGEIAVETQLGRGTTFRVTLPAATIAPTEAKPAPAAAAAPRRGRILVIDDEEAIGRSVRRLLGGDHEVVALTQGTEALRRITAGERFDIILCDVMMPVMTGMDFYAELERSAADQAERVIFVTAGAFTPNARAFLDAVPAPTVEKPFDVAELTALINERLRQR
jgi:PAS domain S-box-containing protein